ncbi:glutaminase A [Desulfogranum mediterraneum]|uniref:glutaminase A n=1 Tax=Desulfogranum mediterraneum TaxID=160661 RepID=UPI0003FDE4E1|nr:glutaminase A [Desulfogranum mediterraneum]
MSLRPRLSLTIALAAVFMLCTAPLNAGGLLPVAPEAVHATLAKVHKRYQADASGKVADYIPALAKADPNHFGLAIVTADGQTFTAGDTDVPFAIESISKVFALALAFEDAGRQAILDKVGVYHTGLPFNSAIASDVRQVKQQNPFVNVGAITTTSFIRGKDSADKWKREKEKFSLFAGQELSLNRIIFDSEEATNQHNRALAWLFKSFGYLQGEPADAVNRYTRACSLEVSCLELAVMGACLANGGVNPMTGRRAVKEEFVRDILSLMAITGLYDASGPWFFRTGLPGKSGVGGGILAVVPGRFAIAAYSPPLDRFGNSVRGVRAVEALSDEWGLHLLGVR